jgi:hypothetical protein
MGLRSKRRSAQTCLVFPTRCGRRRSRRTVRLLLAGWAWTLTRTPDPYDSYIILSFVNGTLVLSIGETIEEVQDTGFLSSAPTLAVQQIGADALLQVHPHGIRHVLADRRVNEWRSPEGRTIVAATTNKRQVVVALSSAELVYFELDLEGQLNEYQDRKPLGSTVLAMSVGAVPEDRQRTPFLAVGCEDQTVRIISLDPESTLETISLQALTAPPSSLCVAEMLDASVNKSHPTTFVNIGLQNGVLLRTVLDPLTGQLTDTRTRSVVVARLYGADANPAQVPWDAACEAHPGAGRAGPGDHRALLALLAQLHAPGADALHAAHI